VPVLGTVPEVVTLGLAGADEFSVDCQSLPQRARTFGWQ
jgi:hypothetical protein